MKVLGLLAPTFADIKFRSDDDLIDKLHHRLTSALLVLMALMVSAKQYVGSPVQCWTPAEFTDSHEEYTNNICWVSNTYYVPIQDRRIPAEGEPRLLIGYYQWVPMVLLIQAFLFHLPCWLWRFFNNTTGINIDSLVTAAKTMDLETQESTIGYMVRMLDIYLCFRRKRGSKTCARSCLRSLAKRDCTILCGRQHGNYILGLYIVVKLIYTLNCASQIVMLNIFLGGKYHVYGLHVIYSLLSNNDWGESEWFPHVTMCDFKVRKFGNIHRYTVQCVLPINYFNEKVFLMLWFWLMLILVASICSLAVWLVWLLVPRVRYRFIRKFIKVSSADHSNGEKLGTFISGYLRTDGVFVLKIVASNCNSIVTGELISELWQHYKNKFEDTLQGTSTSSGLGSGSGSVNLRPGVEEV